ncbi:MAG: tyrosine--tRNA ligase [Nanoarchaeota archaeon]|nr:tyrosine--tRNA ligase [Nanoarchaeota archaeon]
MKIDPKVDSALHVIKGAAQSVLGTKLTTGVFGEGMKGRLTVECDIKPTDEQVKKIEKAANEKIKENVSFETMKIDRKEAEKKFGDIIYDKFRVPDKIKEITIVNIKDWNINCCIGSHVKRTGEIGKIILKKHRFRESKKELELSFEVIDGTVADSETKDTIAEIETIIAEKELKAEIIRHPHRAVRNLQDHLELHKDKPDHVLKVLCMVSKGKPLAVIASGEVEIDTKKLCKIGKFKEVRMANKEELFSLFGREPGGVDVLTIPKEIPLFADKKLFEKNEVIGSAGSPYAGLKIDPKEILKIRKPVVGVFAVKLPSNIQKRLDLIKEVGEEIVQEDELIDILREKKKFVAYDGFEPSGVDIHIAQGLLRAININKMIKAGAHFKIWIADWHAWANNKMGGDLEKIQFVGKYYIEVWKACGLDMENVEFVWASEAMGKKEYWKTVMQIARHSTVNRIVRAGQIMGRGEKEVLQASQIFYPCMQAADIFYLNVDVTQLGMDQRKCGILAREIGPKIGHWKPIVVSHHMLMGLNQPTENSDEKDKTERTIALKMSKSKPDTAIFMTDLKEEINRKMKKAWCPEGIADENPVLEYFKYIIFEKYEKIIIKRPEKWGGNSKYSTFEELEDAFIKKEVHPMDLKIAVSEYIDELISPIREKITNDPKIAKMREKIRTFEVTR